MKRSSLHDQRGLTLTELMVAIAVSLLATLAIFQAFAIAEGHRRTATSGGDASFGGMVGTHLLQRDLRMAGYGMNSPVYLGCRVLGADMSSGTARAFEFRLSPVVITQGSGNAPDSLTVVYSGSDRLPAPIKLAQAMASATDSYRVTNPYGIFAGDLLIAAETGRDCTLAEATVTPSSAPVGQRDLVPHTNTSYTNAQGVAATARYNSPAGLGVTYTLDGVLMNVGTAPVVNTYAIAANGLVVDQPLLNVTGAPVAANVVQLQAEYGIDANNNAAIESTEWSTTTPTTAVGWTTVLAVRYALAVRSALPERPDPVSGACSITTANPTWAGGTLDVSADANWRCYRYRVFEGATSLRNLIWRPE